MSEKKKSYGKEFEHQVYKNFSEIGNVSIDRIPDQVTKYRGSSRNICDFIVYDKPNLIYLECKTVHGSTLPFSNIRENQWNGLLEKSKIDGVIAGIMCWFIDHDITEFIPIQALEILKNEQNAKSLKWETVFIVSYDEDGKERERFHMPVIGGKKKRIMFEYDMKDFLAQIKNNT